MFHSNYHPKIIVVGENIDNLNNIYLLKLESDTKCLHTTIKTIVFFITHLLDVKK